MTGKRYGWHKAWQRLHDGRLRHVSGVEFTVEPGDGLTDIRVTPESLDAFQAYEAARGVPVHDMTQRLLRLAREASRFLEYNSCR